MNKQKFTAQIEVEAIISQAQKELAKLGKDVNKSWQDGSPPKGMLKQLESMRTRLTSLQNLTSKGVIDSSGLSSAKNDFKGLSKEIRQLTIEYQLFTTEQKKAMLSPEEQSNMKARAEAMNKYTQALKENQKVLKERADIEQKQATTLANRKQLEAQKKGLQDRAANFADDSFLSKEAQEYAKNLREEAALKEEILRLDKKIEAERRKGTPEESKRGGNDLTRAKDQRAEKENRLKSLDLASGKAAYEKESAVQKQNIQQLENEIKSIDAQIEEADVSLENFEKTLKNLKPTDAAAEFNKLKQSLKECGVEGVDNVKDFDELKKIVQKLDKDALSKVDKSVKNFVKQLKLMEEQVDQVGEALEDSADSIKNQEAALARANAIEDRIKSFLGFAGATEVLKTSARRATATIKELDATMGEMAVVTDLTVGDYWDQLPEYSQRASDLGVSINSAYKAATLYYQQGLKANEVTALSAETLKMAQIAGLDAADATDKMTAALRGFNMELNETSAQRVSDVYSELAAITAADTKEIANAMTKTASIASNAGMEFETTAAFLSQIIETTRESAETAGTAMKTVIARFQELKKDPAEIGEVDGEIVDANKIETALRSVGVSLRDANGQFRDLDDVFLELSSKWDTLDTNTQRYIATIAAGSRQQSRFIAMMSDYGRTQELVTAANNSAGASQRQFEKTMETLQYKLTQLKNAWDEFSMGILESDLVKVGVDILTKFLQTVNKATSEIKGLGGSIVKILSVISLFKLGQKIFEKLKQPMFKFFNDLTDMAFNSGRSAGQAYQEGLEASKKTTSNKPKTLEEKVAAAKEKRKDTFSDKFNRAIGKTQRLEAKESFAKNKEEKYTSLDENGNPVQIDGKDVKINAKQKLDELRTDENGTKLSLKKVQQNKINKVIDLEADRDTKAAAYNEAQSEYTKILNEERALNAKKPKAKNKTGRAEWEAKQKDVSERKTAAETKRKGAQNAFNAAEEDYKKAQEELVEFDEIQTEVQANANEGWQKMGESISSMGASITGVGVACSALGGIMASMGMEEAGETFATVGNILTIVGGAFSTIGTLVPIVTKILVASGYSVQGAWWPLLVIGLALAALVGTVMLIVSAIKEAEAQKLENRMKAAAEATEEAKSQAQDAKKAYEDLLSDKSAYNELQQTLEDLTYGTKEWKEALIEANEQVLHLLETYPELVSYLERSENGQLSISDEGWDKVIESQKKAVANTQNRVLTKQMDEKNLSMEGATQSYNQALLTGTATYNSDTGQWVKRTMKTADGEIATVMDLLDEELREIYINQNSSLKENTKEAERLMQTYGITNIQLERAAEALEKNRDEIVKIENERIALARASLTASAPDEVLNSTYGQEVIDAFATTVGGDVETSAENKVKTDVGTKNPEQKEEFMALAEEYGVKSQMTTDDKTNFQKLYAAMAGLDSIEDIPDSLKDDKAALLEAIAEMKVANERTEKMVSYTEKLDAMAKGSPQGKADAQNIAGLFSENGKDMSIQFANGFFKDGEFNKEKVEEIAKSLDMTVDEWAASMNMTTDELYEQAEKNSNEAIKTNEAAFEKINNIRSRYDKEAIEDYGVQLSAGLNAGLTEKLSGVFQIAGEGGLEVQKALTDALQSSDDDATAFAQVLEGMNWNSAEDWEKLPEILDGMDIQVANDKLENLIETVQQLGISVEILNFKKLTEQIQDTIKLMRDIQSGSQGRVFDQSSYDLLVKSNADLAKDFVQIGNEFHYLGGSMRNLSDSLRQKAAEDMHMAAWQKETQLEVANAMVKFKQDRTDLDDYNNWTKEQNVAFLEEFRSFAQAEGVDTFSTLTDAQGNPLGLSKGANFLDYDNEELKTFVQSLMTLDPETLTEETAKALSDARVAENLLHSGSSNLQSAREARAQITSKNTADDRIAEATADDYSKALSIQATETGMVADAVISEYNELVAKDFAELEDKDRDRMAELENVLEQAIIENTQKLEDLQTINDYTTSVADALQTIAQQEIDKLSAINDSINTANERMIGKIQEQIDDARQERQRERMREDIAKSQSQLAYLMSDTSGANALEAQQLQESIKQQQENYQDTMIDQSLQNLADDNAFAAEQRERQIALMEAQLTESVESGALMREAERITQESLAKINDDTQPLATELYDILAKAELINSGVDYWTEEQRDQFNQEFAANTAAAADAQNSLNAIDEKEGEGNEETKVNFKEETMTALESFLKSENNAATQAETNTKTRDSIVKDTAKTLKENGGWKATTTQGTVAQEAYSKAQTDYIKAGGNAGDFETLMKNEAESSKNGVIAQGKYSHLDRNKDEPDTYGHVKGYTKIDGTKIWYSYQQPVSDGLDKELTTIYGKNHQQIVLYNGIPYIYANERTDGNWTVNPAGWKQLYQNADYYKGLTPYETGGIADFTGPAWLDGTKSRPELVLNARDTQNFIQLKDILAEIMDKGGMSDNSTSNGDNYFDIQINVEDISDDYDVEQLANKIRSMIYEDATYRNVNAVSHISR